MGPLTKRLTKQLERLGRDRAAVARAIQSLLTRGVGDAAVAAGVVESRFKSLVEGQPEGIDYFFEDPERLTVLARVVELDRESLVALREAQSSFRVLVLDRRLDLATRRYLKRRQAKQEERFGVVEAEGATREALLEAARAEPVALVVLAGAEDEPFFAEAGVEITQIHWHRRGYVLDRFPELVPLPPAPPPRLVDDDGRPMIPLEALEEQILAGPASTEQDRVKAIIEQGATPSFPVDVALAHLAGLRGRQGSCWVEDLSREGALTLFEAFRTRAEETMVWLHEGHLFFVGTEDPELLEPVREHHLVQRPSSFAQALEQLDGLNPFRCVGEEGETRFGGKWQAIREAVLKECGVDISGSFPGWRERVEARAQPGQVFTQQAASLEAKARSAIEGLAARPMSLPLGEAQVVFALRRLASAALVVIPPERTDLFHVVADLGGGQLLWARAISFPDEEPRPLHYFGVGAPWEGYEDAVNLDGGDVHLWLKIHRSQWLAGSTPEPVVGEG